MTHDNTGHIFHTTVKTLNGRLWRIPTLPTVPPPTVWSPWPSSRSSWSSENKCVKQTTARRHQNCVQKVHFHSSFWLSLKMFKACWQSLKKIKNLSVKFKAHRVHSYGIDGWSCFYHHFFIYILKYHQKSLIENCVKKKKLQTYEQVPTSKTLQAWLISCFNSNWGLFSAEKMKNCSGLRPRAHRERVAAGAGLFGVNSGVRLWSTTGHRVWLWGTAVWLQALCWKFQDKKKKKRLDAQPLI